MKIKYLFATAALAETVPVTVTGPTLAGVISLSTQYDVVVLKAGVV